MRNRTLQQILLDQTDYYLDKDNPLPKTPKEKLFKIFAASGIVGRNVALAYKKNTLDQKSDDNKLLQKTLAECEKTEGDLGTSSVYRKRLLQGICLYLNITKEQIKKEAKRLEYPIETNALGVFAMGGFNYGGTPPNKEANRKEAMLKLIKSKLNFSQQYNNRGVK